MKITKLLLTAVVAMVVLSGCSEQKEVKTVETPSAAETAPVASQPVKNLLDNTSGDIEAYESSDVNAVVQARPSIMVIPGDQILKDCGCISTEKANGREFIIRDYKGFLLKNNEIKQVISFIQNEFNDSEFPLNDFEQTLKQLDTQEAFDMADGLEKDARTMLSSMARPDIILEFTYEKGKPSLLGHNYNASKSTSYTLRAIDAYSSKVVAAINGNDISGASIKEAMQQDIKRNINKFQGDIQKYFNDILTRGRDVTVRVVVESGSGIALSDESIEGDTYTDWIIDYMKANTVKGAHTMVRNTDYELAFTNCRIKLLNDDGTQYGVYDWARDLQKDLRRNLGLKCANKAQGLGEVLIAIQGLRTN
ncbi:MAG: hypothetical protein E7087_03345 [Bacteroidales bacterium]|nr:hypothetical protein [Bacteroidales bacterium]